VIVPEATLPVTAVYQALDEVPWRNGIFALTVGRAILSVMRQGWLESSTGMNVVAIGLVAIVFSLVLFTVQDLWILVTGTPYALHGLRGDWYLLSAAIATIFSAMTVFIWRPGLSRIVIGLFSMSMASHILEQFVGLPAQELKLAALCRIFIAVGLILLVLRYRSTTTFGKS